MLKNLREEREREKGEMAEGSLAALATKNIQ